MSTTALILLLVAVLVAQIPILGFCLWLSGKIVRAPGAKFRAAIKLACILAAAHAVLLPILLWSRHTSSYAAGVTSVLELAIVLILIWLLIKHGFKTTGKRALVALPIVLITDVVLGLLLAFSIRTYLVEAFVVPTGSMATTILGVHCNVKCPNCGWEFPIRLMERFRFGRADTDKYEVERIRCTNCGHSADVEDFQPESGDRILADKTTPPKRWDCVVYRSPDEPAASFVHRVVGLSNEKLTICGGDLFVDGTRLVKQPDELTDLWFPVNDTSFIPQRVDDNTLRWTNDAQRWKNDAGRWSFDGSGADKAELSFHGQITDGLAYNAELTGILPAKKTPVGDIRVDCEGMAKLDSDGGSWGLRWTFDGRTVQAAILPSGTINLSVDSKNQADLSVLPMRSTTGKYASTGSSTVSLSIRDGFACVLQNGQRCATLQIAPSKVDDTPGHSDPEPGELSIYADKRGLEIARIRIFRDVYYTQPTEITGLLLRPNPYSIQLQPNELFVLGDNSATAKDSRYQIKAIFPKDIVGVARWRYWPPNRWHAFQ